MNTNTNIQLFALDMDGTLLQPDHRTIADTDQNSIRQAVEAGAIFVPATGRMAHFIPEPVQALSCWRYAITSNGASVFDRESGEILYADALEEKLVKKMLKVLEPFSQFYEIYADGQSFTEKKRLEDPDRYHIPAHSVSFFRSKCNLLDSMEELLDGTHRIEKIYIPYLPQKSRNVMKELLELFPVAVTSSVGDNLEVNAKTANKGNALKFLQEYLHLEQEQLMAVGDQDNDLPMIRYAGTGVAMGNALDLVKKEADFVTKTNVENGVSYALQRLVLGIQDP